MVDTPVNRTTESRQDGQEYCHPAKAFGVCERTGREQGPVLRGQDLEFGGGNCFRSRRRQIGGHALSWLLGGSRPGCRTPWARHRVAERIVGPATRVCQAGGASDGLLHWSSTGTQALTLRH